MDKFFGFILIMVFVMVVHYFYNNPEQFKKFLREGINSEYLSTLWSNKSPNNINNNVNVSGSGYNYVRIFDASGNLVSEYKY